jgi:kynurenine formamidase
MQGELLGNDDMRAIFAAVSNWGRWGQNDELGTLNFITPEKRRSAAMSVTEGRCVSLARDFPTAPGPHNPFPAQHHMLVGGDDSCCLGIPGLEMSQDFIGIAFHGLVSTHIDALCHVFADGRMFNGFPASEVLSTGARRNTIMAVRDGIIGRGVLLDMPAALGVSHVPAERRLGIAELEAAERVHGAAVGSGDILIVRTGRDVDRTMGGEQGAASAETGFAGLHPEVLPWLHEREVAALGGDGIQDPFNAPPNNKLWPMPIHTCGLTAMGLHLLDNLYLEDVARMAQEVGRWTFQLCIAPLRIQGGTGSPINPIAMF